MMLRISSILLSLSLALPSLVVSGPVVGSLLDAKTDSYIVTLRSGNALSDFLSGLRSTITAQGGAGSINYEYKILNGFSGVFSGSILDLIKNAPQVRDRPSASVRWWRSGIRVCLLMPVFFICMGADRSKPSTRIPS